MVTPIIQAPTNNVVIGNARARPSGWVGGRRFKIRVSIPASSGICRRAGVGFATQGEH